MIGNDANVDILQLGARITGTTEVATILAKHSEWDRALRCLKLPALYKDGLKIHGYVDHLGLASWRGDTTLSSVNLQTCWKLGCLQIKQKFPTLVPVLESIAAFDMFSPLGINLVKAHQDPDDIDNTIDEELLTEGTEVGLESELEDAISESKSRSKFDPCFILDGTKVNKSQYLSQAFKS
ncbi:hypothetical protein C0992_011696 [Termitomyces sp. T32_za158]|nr:hypothetical protein C0992_011696 [Termitomyces sp. T32_za158]